MNRLKCSIILLLLSILSISANAQCKCTAPTDEKNCNKNCCSLDSISNEDVRYSPSTLIIWYKQGRKKKLLKAVKKYNAEILYDYKNFNGVAIKIPQGMDINSAIAYFKKVKGVLQVNRDSIMHLD